MLGFVLLQVSLIGLVLILGTRYQVVPQVIVTVVVQAILSLSLLQVVGLSGDSGVYDMAALQQADYWTSGTSPTQVQPFGKTSFIWVLALIYYLAGHNPALALVFLATLMGFVPVLVALTVRSFGFSDAEKLAAWLAVFSPWMLLWTPHLRREGIVFIILLVCLLSMGLVVGQRLGFALVVSLSAAALLWVSRPQLLLVLAAGLLIATLQNRLASRNDLIMRIALTTFALGFVVIALTSHLTNSVLDSGMRERIVNANSDESEGLAITPGLNVPMPVPEPAFEASQNILITTALDASSDLWMTAWGTLRVIAGPFIWEWSRGLNWFLVGLDGAAFFVSIVAMAFFYGRYSDMRKMLRVVLVAAIPLVAGTVITLANYGIVARVRAHMMMIFLPAIAVGLWHVLQASRQRRREG